MSERNLLKGDDFLNRYRIEGTLTTQSPLHIGDGGEDENRGPEKKQKGEAKKQKDPEKEEQKDPVRTSTVVTDWENKAVIPGSSLKGAMRNYLLQIFSSVHGGMETDDPDVMAACRDYNEWSKKFQNQNDQICAMRVKASILERLFGTPFAAGKTDFWDGECITEIKDGGMFAPKRPPFLDKKRRTCVYQSVAIDPETGTALEKKLYHFEAVPPGVSFKITICGQNLVYVELGMILFALNAFNSEIWPLTLGGMGGRGFGRMNFKLEQICFLGKNDLSQWVKDAAQKNHAGYLGLKKLEKDEQEKHIVHFKECFLNGLEVSHAA
jgi:CRISPR/Cas system CSM-associated protein Csm3 (group 7 of RAMP superfamily)